VSVRAPPPRGEPRRQPRSLPVKKVAVASYLVRSDHVASVAPWSNIQVKYRACLTEGLHNVDLLVSDQNNLSFAVSGLPTEGDVNLPVEIQHVIEVLSRYPRRHCSDLLPGATGPQALC
jgi:hypothetical protein